MIKRDALALAKFARRLGFEPKLKATTASGGANWAVLVDGKPVSRQDLLDRYAEELNK